MTAVRSVARIARSLLPVGMPILTALLLLVLSRPCFAQQRALPQDLQARVNKAIDDGVNYLKLTQNALGTWTMPNDEHAMGYAALGGLTLLVCGVPADDPVIVKAARFVRPGASACDRTYELALGILFLDKLGEVERAQGLAPKKNSDSRKDGERIEMMALRLIAGQSPTGGWTYKCPVLSHNLQEQLKKALRSKKEMKPAALGDLRELPVLQKPSRMPPVERVQDRNKPIWGQTDNSNTQFAMLAVWAARRHGVPVERTLKLVIRRFESSQNQDGSWSYDFKLGGGPLDRPAMICVGLLGLAIGNGMAQDAHLKDAPAAMKAAATIGQPGLAALLVSLDRIRQQVAIKEAAKKAENDKRIVDGFLALDRLVGEPTGKLENHPPVDLYRMWSIERVAVLYNLALLGKKDWYRWGAEILVAIQLGDGSWAAKLYHGSTPPIDTCFALLFLKRSNLASDLSASLASNTGGLAKDIEEKQSKRVETAKPPPPPQTSPPASPTPAPVATEPVRPVVASPKPAAPKEDFSPPPERGSNTLLYVLLGTLMLLLIGAAVAAYVLTRSREDDDDDSEAPVRKASRNGKGSRSGVRARSHKK